MPDFPGHGPKPLIDYSDEELARALRTTAEATIFSYAAMQAEFERRANNRRADEAKLLASAVALAAIFNAIVILVDRLVPAY